MCLNRAQTEQVVLSTTDEASPSLMMSMPLNSNELDMESKSASIFPPFEESVTSTPSQEFLSLAPTNILPEEALQGGVLLTNLM